MDKKEKVIPSPPTNSFICLNNLGGRGILSVDKKQRRRQDARQLFGMFIDVIPPSTPTSTN